MREVAFLRKNMPKWEEFERLLHTNSKTSADVLAELYIELTNDLAFAQSFYPDSKTTQYLNDLSIKAHNILYKNRKEESKRIITFWTKELPILFSTKQKELLYAFIIFGIAFSIGILSAAKDNSFVRLVMGDQYVNMTIDNIENGDPLAVYKGDSESNMFMKITTNNIRVSFMVFITGLFTPFATGILLFQNGIMLGSFLQFFRQFGVIDQAMLVVFIHGTLEISAIIIAGSAGIVLGNSFLFPGTYTRSRSFIKGSKEGLKMVIGLVPIFIIAGFLESFVTRYTEMPLFLSLGIIMSSLAFILYYFVILPNTIKAKNLTTS